MEELEEKDLIDYKKYLRILLKFWYIGLLVMTAAYFAAYFSIRYATPIYKVSTTLQIKDKSSYASTSKTFLEGASMFQPYKNLKNEIELIKSYNRIQLVVKELDFTWGYIIKGKFRDIDVYKTIPLKILSDSGFIVTNVPFNVKIVDKDHFSLSVSMPGVRMYDPITFQYVDTTMQSVAVKSKIYKFGETISFGLLNLRIVKTHYFSLNNIENEFVITARDIHYLTKLYKSKISVAEGEKSSIVTISSSGSVVEQEVDFLTKLSDVYIRKELEEKNRIATNTINFIDSQLNVISDSLKRTEGNIQSFKEENNVYAIGQQAETVYGQLAEMESKKLELEIQIRYYEYLKQYLYQDKSPTDLVAPSTINITEGVLTKLVEELILLNEQKNTILYTSSEKSPAYQTVLIRIKTTKEALLETTNNLVQTSKASMVDLNGRIKKLESEIAKIPAKERSLINIQRQQIINDNIYNYLLQKRAEASIARASNLSDAFVVESPRMDEFVKIAPQPQKIYTSYLLSSVGVIILLTIIYGKFDNKIHSKEDVSKIISISILGTIPFIVSDDEEKIVATGHGRLTESFRSIRSNLQFMLQGKKMFIIGVTSCISGDGKSFCSHNLARVYAISGKKTLLIRGDLRKLVSVLDYNLEKGAKGLSEYLAGVVSLNEIIHDGDIEGLSFIVPGPIPPNASELFASSQMQTFIKACKEKFDVIVFDSPPVGLVSDYMSILELMDINIYVVRDSYTPKASLEVLREIKIKHGVTNHAILYNGAASNASSYYYGSYEQKELKKWWQKLLRIV
jgi:tyrosine-protein kinase Etk/Wzc